MSSENIYSLAQEYEEKYNKCADMVQLVRQGKENKSKMSDVSQQLENLDYLLNQMDLEVSLLPKEDQADISIHKTCRNHFNDLRKKTMEVETQVSKKSTPKTPVVDTEAEAVDNSLMGSSYEQGVQDLRTRYGVTSGLNEASVPEELLMYRQKKIVERRIMISAVVVCAAILIALVIKFL
jgi:Vesicle transport v-SNARE protein N-terminus